MFKAIRDVKIVTCYWHYSKAENISVWIYTNLHFNSLEIKYFPRFYGSILIFNIVSPSFYKDFVLTTIFNNK